jgi:ferrochelatase
MMPDPSGGAGAATGVLLTNLGGPWTLNDVEPFLTRLFSDRDIIRLPGGARLQPALARLVARLRGPAVRRRYAGIGGGSPQLSITGRQAAALEAALNGDGGQFRVAVAMRYASPSSNDALEAMAGAHIRRIVVLPLYPQYSTATTGSSDRELARALARPEWRDRFELTGVRSYPGEPRYLDALAETVRRALDRFPADRRDRVVLLFSAHALPQATIDNGDPYVAETELTRQGVLARLGIPNRHTLAYQSRSGPVRWIGPGTGDMLVALGREGVRDVLVVPISFVSDHIETLYELDQLYAGQAARAGITGYGRAEALNDSPAFIEALAAVVRRHLQGES